ncbi:uncharacterized protein BT62DRAFT_937919 [Guyanagaster necrorhizus]|uniref:LysM domain-containing protein n=1 Tax=Guyanagaster necrorhizus TaxID=856835 RepID=A0A9P7VHL2_9AGAR|nr:uncharacterized protein BT62DRAFT_937919 [Guyanagaster necrorhizus MCA 3950]KAG7440520.1 hypothetical protein BT62DRAFT_937919 [Guyanagaster necrorhizus MCA 3950]
MFSSKALSFAIVALPFVARSVVAQCTRNYTIQDGDICDSISAANNVSTYQLATINAGYINSACSNLEIGANICLGYSGEDCTETYVVEADDTCEGITTKFTVDEATFYNNNPNINDQCTNIYIGEVLCVASTIAVPPAGSSVAATAIPSTATAAMSASTSSTVSTATPITPSTITPVTSSTITPVTSSTITPVTSSTITPVTSSTVIPVTTSAAVAPVTTLTYATTSSSTAASAASSAASTDGGDDGDDDDGDDDDLPWCDEL